MELNPLAEKILSDLEPYFLEGYGVTGSNSYKLLIPGISNKPIKDIDFVAYPLKKQNVNLINKNITNKFYVTRIFLTIRGYQLGLVHKDIGCWVDIFPRTQEPLFKVITDKGREIRLHMVEEIAYGICVATLEKVSGQRSKTVEKNHLDTLKLLAPYINPEVIKKVVDANLSQNEYMAKTFGKIINTPKIIQYVIENYSPYNPPGYNLKSYPSNQAVMPNGLSVEEPAIYNRAMEHHSKYLASRRIGNSE